MIVLVLFIVFLSWLPYLLSRNKERKIIPYELRTIWYITNKTNQTLEADLFLQGYGRYKNSVIQKDITLSPGWMQTSTSSRQMTIQDGVCPERINVFLVSDINRSNILASWINPHLFSPSCLVDMSWDISESNGMYSITLKQ